MVAQSVDPPSSSNLIPMLVLDYTIVSSIVTEIFAVLSYELKMHFIVVNRNDLKLIFYCLIEQVYVAFMVIGVSMREMIEIIDVSLWRGMRYLSRFFGVVTLW